MELDQFPSLAGITVTPLVFSVFRTALAVLAVFLLGFIRGVTARKCSECTASQPNQQHGITVTRPSLPICNKPSRGNSWRRQFALPNWPNRSTVLPNEKSSGDRRGYPRPLRGTAGSKRGGSKCQKSKPTASPSTMRPRAPASL